jgi:hypothetical protein
MKERLGSLSNKRAYFATDKQRQYPPPNLYRRVAGLILTSSSFDSRKVKKLIIERLEDEKDALIDDMAKQLPKLHRRNKQLLLKIEEMVRSDTIETGELRKKVAILTEHVQRLQDAVY